MCTAPTRLQLLMEAVVLLTVVLTPWAFGSVHPLFQLLVAGGLAILLGLWALRMALERQVTWTGNPALLCLVGLYLLGVLQVLPLSQAWLELLSPKTFALRQELLPAAPEQLVTGEQVDLDNSPVAQTISVYAGATRSELVGWLAIVALFAVVCNNLAYPGFWRRLAVVALANGAALALVGLLQFLSSPRHVLYWSWPSQGTVFGPFINRNHFAAYMNLCIGLALGVLLSGVSRGPMAARTSSAFEWQGAVAALLRPQVLGAGLALTVMLAATVISLSRGGLVALAVAGMVCLVLWCWRSRRYPRLWGLLLVGVGPAALVVWLALPAVSARLGTLWPGQGEENGRLKLWARLLPLWRDFPAWGTGYGTLAYVEPLGREPGQDRHIYYDNADNDYVQILVEGGTVGLVLAVSIVVFVVACAGRVFLRARDRRTAGLALGSLFAWTTVVVHSFFDYGLHVPAVTVLATVIAAQLTAPRPGNSRPTDLREQSRAGGTLHLRGLAPILASMAALVIGLVVVREGWCAAKAECYRLAAVHCKPSPALSVQARRRSYLHAAVRLLPDNAALQLELAEAYLGAFEQQEDLLHRATEARSAGEAAWAGGSLMVTGTPSSFPLVWATGLVLRDASGREADRQARERERDKSLRPALNYFVRARNLCPLLGHAQVRLGTYAGVFAQADRRGVYLRRAARLMPHDERIWFACGARALAEGKPEEAWPCWRRSLECSPHFLRPVLDQSAGRLTDQELAAKVLPPDAQMLYQAALLLADRPDAGSTTPLVAAALRLLEQRGGDDSKAWYLRARCHQLLGHANQALQAYRECTQRAPAKTAWRLEFIHLLADSGQLQEARLELVHLLQVEPGNNSAKELYKTVVEKLTQGD